MNAMHEKQTTAKEKQNEMVKKMLFGMGGGEGRKKKEKWKQGR